MLQTDLLSSLSRALQNYFCSMYATLCSFPLQTAYPVQWQSCTIFWSALWLPAMSLPLYYYYYLQYSLLFWWRACERAMAFLSHWTSTCDDGQGMRFSASAHNPSFYNTYMYTDDVYSTHHHFPSTIRISTFWWLTFWMLIQQHNVLMLLSTSE